MATVNFSIPDDVKELFNSAFSGKNRSAVVAELMRQAAEHELVLRPPPRGGGGRVARTRKLGAH